MISIEDARARAEIGLENRIDDMIQEAVSKGETEICLVFFTGSLADKVIQNYVNHGYKIKRTTFPFLTWE